MIITQLLTGLLLLSVVSAQAAILHMKNGCIVTSFTFNEPTWNDGKVNRWATGDRDIRYYIDTSVGTPPVAGPFSFSFTYSPTTPGTCGTAVMDYAITINAQTPDKNPILINRTNRYADWFHYNQGDTQWSMSTGNLDFLGIYTGIIQGDLDTNVPMYNSGKFEFHITIGDHPCVLQKLKDVGIDDMYFQIRDGQPPTVQPFDEFVDLPNNHITQCGPRLYAIDRSDKTPTSRYTADPPNASGVSKVYFDNILFATLSARQISIETTNHTLVGKHNITFYAQQKNYPQWNQVTEQLYFITITIDARCHYSYFKFENMANYIYEYGSGGRTYTFTSVPDLVSLTEYTQNGYDYCGLRSYRWSVSRDFRKLTNCDNTMNAADLPTITMNFGGIHTNVNSDHDDTFQVIIAEKGTLSETQHYGTYQIDFYVQLDNYPGFGTMYSTVSATHGQQLLSFTVEITPFCSNAKFTYDPVFALNDPKRTSPAPVPYYWPIILNDDEQLTFAIPTHNMQGKHCDYCGFVETTLVDTDNYNLNIFELSLADPDSTKNTLYLTTDYIAAQIAKAKPTLTTYNNFNLVHTLKCKPNMVWTADEVEIIPFDIDLLDCPVTHAPDTTTRFLDRQWQSPTDWKPYFYVIGVDNLKKYNFAFLVGNALCDTLDEREFWYKINDTRRDVDLTWSDLDFANIDAPYFSINSNDPLDYGCQTMELYSIVTNTALIHTLRQAPLSIKFSVLMYDSNCLWNDIDHDANWLYNSGANNIPFTIQYGNSPVQVTFDEFTIRNHDTVPTVTPRVDPVRSCGDLLYKISGPAVTKKILTLNEATRTLTVWTDMPEYVGVHTATISVEFTLHPWLTWLKKTQPQVRPLNWYIEETMTVTIDSPCDDTDLITNPSFETRRHMIGRPPIWFEFENNNDTYTVQNTPPHEFNGWAYCKDRKYDIISIVNVTKPGAISAILNPPIALLRDEELFMDLFANDWRYYGVHQVTVRITLYRYKLFNKPITQTFSVYILPNCATTKFYTLEPLPVDMVDIVVNQTSNRNQTMPAYISDVETLADSWGYEAGICGKLTYWLEMQNGDDLPYFISLDKKNPVEDTYDYLYVFAKPTNESDAGSWPVQYCVGLSDPEFSDSDKPHCDKFTIIVTSFPFVPTNDLPHPYVPLLNQTLNVNETFTFELWPEDFDEGENVTTTFKVVTTPNQVRCPNCFVWNKEDLKLTVYAMDLLANMTTVFQVCYNDTKEINCLWFAVTIVAPFEQTPQEIAQEEQAKLEAELANKTIVNITYTENQLILFKESRCGYLLSGQTFPTRSDEFDCLQELNFPLAVVTYVNETGFVAVNFTHPVPMRENLAKMIEDGLVNCYLVNNAEMFKKKGKPVQLKNLDMDEYRKKIFYSPNGTENRLLATLTREEFDMRIAAEFDEKKSNFNWTVVQFNNSYMHVQLGFDEPDFISTFGYDQIEFEFNITSQDQILKPVTTNNGLVQTEVNYTARGILPPQISEEDQSFARLQVFSEAMFWCTVGLLFLILILCCFTRDSLHYFWTFINFMQLLVHLPLLQVPLPASALYLLRTLFPWFSFTSVLYDYKLSLFSFSGTPPFALSFDRLGYHARHTTVNVGTLNWLIVFSMLVFFITLTTYVLARLIQRCTKCREQLAKSQALPAVWLRLLIELYFVSILCAFMTIATPKDFADYPGLIQLPQSELSQGDRLSKTQTIVTIVLYLVFFAFLVINLTQAKSLADYKFAKLEALHASDILFAFRSTRAEIIQKYARQEAARGFTEKTLKERVKNILLKNEVLDSQLNLQSTANYNTKLINQVSCDKLAQHLQGVKLERMHRLAEARARFEHTRRNLSFWTGKWTRELRKHLKQESALALAFHHVFFLRRAFVVVCVLFMYNYPLYQTAFYSLLSFAQLVYLFYVRPFKSGLKNFVEIFNELVIYLLSFCFISTIVCESIIDGTQFAGIGWWICLVIEIAVVFNLFAIFVSLFDPFRIALKTRSSTRLGRCLRFCCRRRLQTREACTCACCTCKEDNENPSVYPRTMFFEIIPIDCTLLEPEDDEELLDDEKVDFDAKQQKKVDPDQLSEIREEDDDGGYSNLSSRPVSAVVTSSAGSNLMRAPTQPKVTRDRDYSDTSMLGPEDQDQTVNSEDQRYMDFIRNAPRPNAGATSNNGSNSGSYGNTNSTSGGAVLSNRRDDSEKLFF